MQVSKGKHCKSRDSSGTIIDFTRALLLHAGLHEQKIHKSHYSRASAPLHCSHPSRRRVELPWCQNWTLTVKLCQMWFSAAKGQEALEATFKRCCVHVSPPMLTNPLSPHITRPSPRFFSRPTLPHSRPQTSHRATLTHSILTLSALPSLNTEPESFCYSVP